MLLLSQNFAHFLNKRFQSKTFRNPNRSDLESNLSFNELIFDKNARQDFALVADPLAKPSLVLQGPDRHQSRVVRNPHQRHGQGLRLQSKPTQR